MFIFVIQNMPNYNPFRVNCYLKATCNSMIIVILFYVTIMQTFYPLILDKLEHENEKRGLFIGHL